jgi:hypothetical protein
MTTRDSKSSPSVASWESLEGKIEACRAATKAYRDAWALADRLTRELKALGMCGHCAIGQHGWCFDYGCTCCGAGK